MSCLLCSPLSLSLSLIVVVGAYRERRSKSEISWTRRKQESSARGVYSPASASWLQRQSLVGTAGGGTTKP